MLNHLKALCALPGVSGNEGAVRDYIIDHIVPHNFTVDALGNVIVRVKGLCDSGKTILLAAHMDEVGFIVMGITEEGLLKFATVGGMDLRVILGKRVRVGRNALPGIIGLKPFHLTTAEERERAPDVADLTIDIGVSDQESAQKLVSLGDAIYFDSPSFEMGSSIAARALDDRIGCAVLLQLLEEPLPIDVTLAFTVQEEVGMRGATVAGFAVNPDVCFVIEGTTAADLPTVAAEKQICRLGAGVVVPFMDGGTVYDRGLYAQVTTLAGRLEIPWQTKQVIAGGTDAAAIQRAGAGARVLGLAAPVRNLHTGYNVANAQDMDHLLRLTREILAAWETWV